MKQPDYISLAKLDRLISAGLSEDLGSAGDVTTLATIGVDVQATGYFLAKADGVVAGLTVADRVCQLVDPSIRIVWQVDDGDSVVYGQKFGTISGPARGILVAERLMLNLMQRMGGIATLTHQFVKAVGDHKAQILDTRKTAPGMRMIDKWAVHLGGGTNHRIGLFDRMMIKDNHIAAAGGVKQAIVAAKAYQKTLNPPVKLEVEARTLEEVEVICSAGGVDYILLDNMVAVKGEIIDTTRLVEAVKLVTEKDQSGKILTEASGNVTLKTVSAIAAAGVDFISSGALTHSVTALDISLKVDLN